MKKASEYRRHAEECHALANGMTGQQRTNCSASRSIEPRSSNGSRRCAEASTRYTGQVHFRACANGRTLIVPCQTTLVCRG